MKWQMKKVLCVLLVLILALIPMSLCAFAAEEEDIFTFALKGENAILVSCSVDAGGDIAVPSQALVGSAVYPVKYIGEEAFSGCNSVVSVRIPEGVTSIGSQAFHDCTALQEVFIPSTLVMCQYDAFDGCNSVTVHCYKSNYQFFTVYGLASNIRIDILDAGNSNNDFMGSEEDSENGESATIQNQFADFIANSIIGKIIEIIRQILASVGVEWNPGE